jgi:rubrerythrin
MFRKLIRWYNNIKVHTNNEAGSLYRSKNKEDIMYKEELAIISQAVLNEMEGYEFYKMAGDQAKTQGNKEAFNHLANEELKHAEYLKKLWAARKGYRKILQAQQGIGIPSQKRF